MAAAGPVRLLTAAALLLLVAMLANSAHAAEVTRATYTEAVEPICKANTQANEKILAGAKAEVKANKLKPAAVKFTKAAAALKQTYTQLTAVPQPPADTAKLSKWLADVKTETQLFEATAAKLKAGDKTGAEAMVVRLTHTANLANDAALGFEFHYCRFEPSRFT